MDIREPGWYSSCAEKFVLVNRYHDLHWRLGTSLKSKISIGTNKDHSVQSWRGFNHTKARRAWRYGSLASDWSVFLLWAYGWANFYWLITASRDWHDWNRFWRIGSAPCWRKHHQTSLQPRLSLRCYEHNQTLSECEVLTAIRKVEPCPGRWDYASPTWRQWSQCGLSVKFQVMYSADVEASTIEELGELARKTKSLGLATLWGWGFDVRSKFSKDPPDRTSTCADHV